MLFTAITLRMMPCLSMMNVTRFAEPRTERTPKERATFLSESATKGKLSFSFWAKRSCNSLVSVLMPRMTVSS